MLKEIRDGYIGNPAQLVTVRRMRLQEAYVLLGSTTKTIAEIAFEVGFNTPGYFSKCFKEEYGKLPGEIRNGGLCPSE